MREPTNALASGWRFLLRLFRGRGAPQDVIFRDPAGTGQMAGQTGLGVSGPPGYNVLGVCQSSRYLYLPDKVGYRQNDRRIWGLPDRAPNYGAVREPEGFNNLPRFKAAAGHNGRQPNSVGRGPATECVWRVAKS
jgi:hypothetical protein